MKLTINDKKTIVGLNPGLITLGVLALFALIIFWPFVMIWSLNTLFNTGIAFTFWTWLAANVLLLLLLSIQGTRISKK